VKKFVSKWVRKLLCLVELVLWVHLVKHWHLVTLQALVNSVWDLLLLRPLLALKASVNVLLSPSWVLVSVVCLLLNSLLQAGLDMLVRHRMCCPNTHL
jgi:hypothetical protein